LIASAQNQLEDARQTVSQLREQLSQEEQKMESMEYEISGLRQKLTHQEEKSSKLKEALQKSEEERNEYGHLLILANKRADELEETEKQHQQKVEQYENANSVAESNLQEARSDIQKRDKMILELQQSAENHTNELSTHKRESSSATKQLKALSEKTEKLGKENRTLIERLDEMRQTSIRLETENSAIRERIQTANESIESERSDSLADLTAAKQRLSEAESSMKVCRFELEQEKQYTKALTEQLNSANTNINVIHPQTDLEKPLRTLQLQLDVERQKSREVLGQLQTVRNDMAELRRRYTFILEENKQLNEIVEAEVFESDEFCAGMKEYEVNGNDSFTPDSALSPDLYGEFKIYCLHQLGRHLSNHVIIYIFQLHMSMSEGQYQDTCMVRHLRIYLTISIQIGTLSSELEPAYCSCKRRPSVTHCREEEIHQIVV
jgi:chromosome segregation ATPase